VAAVVAKRVNNPDYVAGEDVHVDDIRSAYPDQESAILIANGFKNAFNFISYFLVCMRNNIPVVFYSTFMFLYIFYLCLLGFYDYPCQNQSFLFIQEIVKYTLIVGLLLFFLRNKFMR